MVDVRETCAKLGDSAKNLSKAEVRQLQKFVEKGYIVVHETLEECRLALKGADPVVSKFGMIEKVKPDGNIKLVDNVAEMREIHETMKEMKADLPKAPGDRKHGEPFLERYEALLAKEKEDQEPAAKKQKT